MNDVTLIVDHYQRYQYAQQQGQKIDPVYEAQGLSHLVKPFGRRSRCIAIVSQDDEQGQKAFQNAGYETVTMNGNRPREITKFITQRNREIDKDPPQHLVLVSTDPTFAVLCDHAIEKTSIAVWAPSGNVPSELTDPDYGYMPLEELLPNIRVPRVDIRLDFENLYLGLIQRGWTPNLRALIGAIREEGASVGQVTNIVAYADWDLLAKSTNTNLQRELSILGVDTRYQVNIRGKNSADMKIADDIRTLMERDEADLIILGTCDRDFRPLIETAKKQQKRLMVLGLENGISQLLEHTAEEVRYVDQRLNLPVAPVAQAQGLAPTDPEVELIVYTLALQHETRHRWFTRARLTEELRKRGAPVDKLEGAIANKVYISRQRWLRSDASNQEQMETLELNREHEKFRPCGYITHFLPGRVSYCLVDRGMPYVDTAYLARGMEMDRPLAGYGIGQTRRDAEAWLNLLARAGLLVKKTCEHHKQPGMQVTAWELPGSSAAQAGGDEQAGSPAEADESPAAAPEPALEPNPSSESGELPVEERGQAHPYPYGYAKTAPREPQSIAV